MSRFFLTRAINDISRNHFKPFFSKSVYAHSQSTLLSIQAQSKSHKKSTNKADPKSATDEENNCNEVLCIRAKAFLMDLGTQIIAPMSRFVVVDVDGAIKQFNSFRQLLYNLFFGFHSQRKDAGDSKKRDNWSWTFMTQLTTVPRIRLFLR